MDLNYDIRTWDFSLRTTTLTKITQNVVEAAFQYADSETLNIESKAREIAENLDLLPDMITEIKNLIEPILDEVLTWDQLNDHDISPILTPHGTVDVAKSVRAFIRSWDQDMPASPKFDMACDYCLEKEIFHFGKLLSEAEKLTYEEPPGCFRPMPGFWYRVYKGNFFRMQTLNDLSPANIVAGMKTGLRMRMVLVIKYFLKKAPREIVQQIVNDRDFGRPPIFLSPFTSPDIYVTLFRIDQRHSLKSMFSADVLNTLLKWPYQHLFLKAAKTLVLKFSFEQFWTTALKITMQPVAYGLKDYNYKALFIGFWKMRKDYAGAYVNRMRLSRLLFDVFLMQDKHIAFMVFDDISERNKEEYLHDFSPATLIFYEDYETLRFIMDVCKVKAQPLYIRLKNFAEKNCSCINTCPIFPERNHSINSTSKYKNSLHFFKNLMSEWECSEQLEK